MNKPEFSFGDLVSVAGYHPQLFIVDGFRVEDYYYPNEQWTDIVYELHCAHGGEWIDADEEDLTLIAAADQADEYLRGHPAPAKATVGDTDALLYFMFGGDEMHHFGKKPERKPTARELSAKEAEERKKARKEHAEKIDNLLDLRKWFSDALKRTNNEEFGDRVFAVDAELKKLVDTE